MNADNQLDRIEEGVKEIRDAIYSEKGINVRLSLLEEVERGRKWTLRTIITIILGLVLKMFLVDLPKGKI